MNEWTSTSEHGGVVGIARDGHPIYGPYNEDGELWACDEHDICNGTFMPNDFYAYVATSTFPYILGCYGPGSVQFYPVDEDCSTNSCSAVAGIYFGAMTVIATLAAIAY